MNWLRTALDLIGHSDLEISLNVYTHAIAESQTCAAGKVAEVLLAKVGDTQAALEKQEVN